MGRIILDETVQLAAYDWVDFTSTFNLVAGNSYKATIGVNVYPNLVAFDLGSETLIGDSSFTDPPFFISASRNGYFIFAGDVLDGEYRIIIEDLSAVEHETLTSLFTDIANSIRAKTGDTEQIVADSIPEAIASIPTGGGDEWELINEVTILAGATEANRFSFTQDFNGQPIHLKKAMVLYYYPKYEGSSTPPGYCFSSVNNKQTGANAPVAYTSGFAAPSKLQNRSGYYIVETASGGLPYHEMAQRTETSGARRCIGASNHQGTINCYCTDGTEPATNEITEIGTTGTLVYGGCYFALYGVRV